MGAILKQVLLAKAHLTQRLINSEDKSLSLNIPPICELSENLSSDDVTSSFRSLKDFLIVKA